jgi:hypothetical protein
MLRELPQLNHDTFKFSITKKTVATSTDHDHFHGQFLRYSRNSSQRRQLIDPTKQRSGSSNFVRREGSDREVPLCEIAKRLCCYL